MAEETKTVRYLSRYFSLKLVRKPMRTKEVEGQIITSEGASIRFEEGAYETSDPEEIAYIEARPEFAAGTIIRVPDNVQNAAAHDAEFREDLEAREARLAAREAAVAAREAKVGPAEEGARVETGDGLRSNMKKTDLLKIAKDEGVEGVSEESKNDEIIAAIRAKRAADASGTGESTGGDNGGAAY